MPIPSDKNFSLFTHCIGISRGKPECIRQRVPILLFDVQILRNVAVRNWWPPQWEIIDPVPTVRPQTEQRSESERVRQRVHNHKRGITSGLFNCSMFAHKGHWVKNQEVN